MKKQFENGPYDLDQPTSRVDEVTVDGKYFQIDAWVIFFLYSSLVGQEGFEDDLEPYAIWLSPVLI